jgi:hypothetical protein
MKYIQTLNFFNWKKDHYSEFYIATLISFFVFTLGKPFVVNLTNWLLSAFQAIFQYSPQPGEEWWCLLLVCFVLVNLIKTFIIEPLGFKASVSSKNSWETFLTSIAVFGFFVFVVNTVFFEVILLPEFPLWIKRLIQPLLVTNASSVSVAEKSFWSLIPWLWTIAPIFAFYFSLISKAVNSGGGDGK